MILPDFLSRFPRQLNVRHCRGCARPCGRNGVCIGHVARHSGTHERQEFTPEHSLLPPPLAHSQIMLLTANPKTLQSP